MTTTQIAYLVACGLAGAGIGIWAELVSHPISGRRD